jgi:hypothetical protein
VSDIAFVSDSFKDPISTSPSSFINIITTLCLHLMPRKCTRIFIVYSALNATVAMCNNERNLSDQIKFARLILTRICNDKSKFKGRGYGHIELEND